MIRPVQLDDTGRISEIYNHYVLQTPITFEEVSVTLDEMRRRIQETTQAYPWLVCEDDDVVVGYCYAHKWKERSAYRHSVEISIYLDRSTVGQGRGSALLDALLSELRGRKFHCAIGGTLVPNPASIALLEKFGFRPIAHFKEVGYKFNRWIDVGYWQLML